MENTESTKAEGLESPKTEGGGEQTQKGVWFKIVYLTYIIKGQQGAQLSSDHDLKVIATVTFANLSEVKVVIPVKIKK